MIQSTIEIKRHHRNLYDVCGSNDETKNLHQCEMIVLLASRLMTTMMDGCKDGDDIEIIIARYGKEGEDE